MCKGIEKERFAVMTQKVKSVEIRLKDFQPFADAHIEAKGLTVICGENNIGKTSVYRAVDSVVNNSRHGDKDINWKSKENESEVSLGVEFQDGRKVQVSRRKPAGKGAAYILDGELYETVGTRIVEDVVKRLSMVPFETRRDSHLLNFQPSRERFAVDLFGTRLFDLINELMPQKEVVQVLAGMKEEVRDARSEIRIEEKLAAEEERKAAEIQGLIDDLDAVDGGTDLTEILLEKVRKYENLTENLEAVRKLEESISLLSHKEQVMSEFVPKVEEQLLEAEGIKSRYDALMVAVGSAKVALEQGERLSKVLSSVEDEVGEVETIFTEMEDRPDPVKLLETVKRVKEIQEGIARNSRILEETKDLEALEEIFIDAEGMLVEVSRIGDALSEQKKVQDNLKVKSDELQSLDKEERELKKEIKELEELVAKEALRCQECGAPVDENGKWVERISS